MLKSKLSLGLCAIAFSYSTIAAEAVSTESIDNNTISEKTDDELGSVSGLWFDRSLAGTGFNFIQAENGFIVYYYGYDQDDDPLDDGDPLWLANNGTDTDGSSQIGPTVIRKNIIYNLSLSYPADDNGYSFNEIPAQPSPLLTNGTLYWGEMELTFTSCNTATARLTAFNDLINYDTTFNLTRLTNTPGTTCID